MQKTFLFLLVLFFSLALQAQEPGDSIIVKDGFWGHRYYIDSNKVSRDVVIYIAGTDKQTQKLLRVSRIQRSVGKYVLAVGVISTASIIFDGWQHSLQSSHWFTATKPVNLLAAIGAVGGLSFGILTLHESNWRFQKAISIYNADIPSAKQTTELKLNMGLNYLSLTYRF